MKSWTRRRALRSAVALSGAPLLGNGAISSADEGKPEVRPAQLPSIVHATDLFRPHDDPDDHWDLVTGYALAWLGDLDLAAVLTDNPLNVEKTPGLIASWNKNNGGVHVARSPDVAAVAQMNYITDRAVPVTTGPIWPSMPGEKIRVDNVPKDLAGVKALLDTLRGAREPISILVVGSCQNVAIAGTKDPSLFAEKCAGIYLNAGTGSQNPLEQSVDGDLEWNVRLNRGAYSTIFDLPCPIYWMPCFHGFSKAGLVPGDYGTFWSFRQKEVLPHLSDRIQAFFAYALSKESGSNWLTYLLDPSSAQAAKKFAEDERGMYSTAAFFHVAGKTVTLDGEVAPIKAAAEKAVYEFIPIKVRCNDQGITEWSKALGSTNRYLFRVRDRRRYRDAMVAALRSTLSKLP